jgi:rare lipoprotein A
VRLWNITGEHGHAAIFAADGKARHRLVRVAAAAGLALLASWLIALSLGVLGGFDSLPGLTGSQSRGSNPVGIRSEISHPGPAPAPQPQPQTRTGTQTQTKPAPPLRTSTTPPVSQAPSRTRPRDSTPKTDAVMQAPTAPSTSTVPGSTPNGRGQGTTRTTTGKPAGSPGNAPGGSGAPGQLR